MSRNSPPAFLAFVIFLFGVVAAMAVEPAPRKTVLFLGDSLTAGFGLEPSKAYPALIQQKIDSAGLGYEAINAGVSGDTTSGGLSRLSWLLRRRIDVLVLALGANDGLRGINPTETKQNLNAIVARVRGQNPGVKILLAGMEMPPNYGSSFAQEFRAVFPAVAEEQHAVLLPFLLAGVGGVPELNQADRSHPTAAGQRIVADNVWRVLEPLLR